MHPNPYVFVHINKTAGSSIEAMLNIPFQHKTALELLAELGPSIWCERIVFSVVRNPWDRVVSQFHYRLKTGQINLLTHAITFKAWVKRAFSDNDSTYLDHPRMFMAQKDWLTDQGGNLLVKRVCRFERLREDLLQIPGIPEKIERLPHLKRSQHGHYRDYYNDVSKNIIGDYFRVDINEFQYEY